MIALLAAVHEETELIRNFILDPSEQFIGGLPLTFGSIAGQSICLTHSGVGKAAAAATASSLLNHSKAEALVLFGCGGAYPNSGLKVGDLAVAEREIFGDEGVATASGFQDLNAMGLPMRQSPETRYNEWPTDPGLSHWAQSQCRDIISGSFVTVSTCTGTTMKALEIEERTNGICENMEGAAVSLACHQHSIPLLEVRGISNIVEDRDLSKWDLAVAMNTVQRLVIDLLKKWPQR